MIKLLSLQDTPCWILVDSIVAICLTESDKGEVVTAIYTSTHVFVVRDSIQRVADLIVLEKQGVGRS